jgi:hypothetical protein
LLWRSPQVVKLTVERNVDPHMAEMMGVEHQATINLFPFVAIQRVDRALLKETLQSMALALDDAIDDADDEDRQPGSSPQDWSTDDELLKLEDMFSADIAGSMLIAQSNIMLAMAQGHKSVSFKIQNAEKKGPVLYLNGQVTFSNVVVKGQKGRRTVVLDREVMVTTIGDTAWVVATAVPTIQDGRSEAYAWVTQWLSNVRIPCECPALNRSVPST